MPVSAEESSEDSLVTIEGSFMVIVSMAIISKAIVSRAIVSQDITLWDITLMDSSMAVFFEEDILVGGSSWDDHMAAISSQDKTTSLATIVAVSLDITCSESYHILLEQASFSVELFLISQVSFFA